MATVRSLKNAAARQDKAAVLTHKINIVNRVLDAYWPLDPANAAVICVGQKSRIAADPPALRISKEYGVQVLATRGYAIAGPPALRKRGGGCKKQDAGGERGNKSKLDVHADWLQVLHKFCD